MLGSRAYYVHVSLLVSVVRSKDQPPVRFFLMKKVKSLLYLVALSCGVENSEVRFLRRGCWQKLHKYWKKLRQYFNLLEKVTHSQELNRDVGRHAFTDKTKTPTRRTNFILHLAHPLQNSRKFRPFLIASSNITPSREFNRDVGHHAFTDKMKTPTRRTNLVLHSALIPQH